MHSGWCCCCCWYTTVTKCLLQNRHICLIRTIRCRLVFNEWNFEFSQYPFKTAEKKRDSFEKARSCEKNIVGILKIMFVAENHVWSSHFPQLKNIFKMKQIVYFKLWWNWLIRESLSESEYKSEFNGFWQNIAFLTQNIEFEN